MKERPILFSGEMVRAILDGKKTQTRRVVKDLQWAESPVKVAHIGKRVGTPEALCPYGQPGDHLWCRETWGHNGSLNCPIHYRADEPEWKNESLNPNAKWHPSIHMPRWASRILLEIVAVRVERLQEISDSDALAEGVTIREDARIAAHIAGSPETPAIMEYWHLWESINGSKPGKSWQDNPWVWVIEFKRVEP